MDWSIKKNCKSLLLLFVFCALIPHIMLGLLDIASTSDFWAPVEINSYGNFIFFMWTPFWASVIAYLRVQKRDTFSLLPAIFYGLITLTFLPRFQIKSVLTMEWIVLLMLITESSTLLKKLESSGNPFLSGIGADRKMLRGFCFWTLGYLFLILVNYEAHVVVFRYGDRVIISPFAMFPVAGLLLFSVFRHHKDRTPTIWSVLVMLAMVPVSFCIVSSGPMAQFKLYHVACLVTGYVILFLMLIIYNIDHWKKPKAANELLQ